MIKIIQAPEKPISLMGECAGICYGKPTEQNLFGTQNYNRGWDCLMDRHGRVFEYPDIIVEIGGYSARAIRELYTHIQGVSRLQQSTRYIDMSGFKYYTPDTIERNPNAKLLYENCMNMIADCYEVLVNSLDIPKEDAANVLPLGSHTSIVLKINFRAMLHLAEERKCLRAYKEIRQLVDELCDVVSEYSEEWQELMEQMTPKCEYLMFCPEKRSCGMYPKREAVALERGLV